MDILNIIVSAIVGGLASLFAPWANWGIEKKRLTRQYRADLVRQWREIISDEWFSRKSFVNHPLYGPLREHLSKEALDMMEPPPNTVFSSLNDIDPIRNSLSMEIAKIEKKWGLR